ncbi:hypothetical protein QFZ67_006930 [Streptomyces sp. V1I1]|nr:hypothetical protein [Streptomyces sp. V1I1]
MPNRTSGTKDERDFEALGAAARSGRIHAESL